MCITSACMPHLPMTQAQRDLAVRYIPLARGLSKTLRLSYPRIWDELESAALLALVQAAACFDPRRKTVFATFARPRIWGALCDVQRNAKAQGWRKREKTEKLPHVIALSPTAEERGLVLNTREDPPVGSEVESNEEVERCLRLLPWKHAYACRQLFVHGKSQREVAEILGCSRSRLSSMHREALTILGKSYVACEP
jgi:RNA polymerase sigma factor (sigma-70 family)